MVPEEADNRPLSCPECNSASPPTLIESYLECLACGWGMPWEEGPCREDKGL